ncbi:MAG: LPS export ABC transporter periplasmic protein LptC [Candidatus Eremiobacteraeota bacterium]|nr:LPS export ABC transporter periplasmic protein LptC [Candidatus Eremiobacteraeota bacterium]
MNARPFVLALALAMPACAPHADTSASPAPSQLASPAATSTGTPAGATPPPVNFSGRRVGSHYVYATKQHGAQTVYVLRADSVNAIYNGALTGRSDFTNPHVTFYGHAGKRLTSDAPAGTVVEKDKSVVMTGGVRARTQDGMTLTSDSLRYEDEAEIVHGVGHVVVTFPTGETLRGETLDWDLRDGHINVGA